MVALDPPWAPRVAAGAPAPPDAIGRHEPDGCTCWGGSPPSSGCRTTPGCRSYVAAPLFSVRVSRGPRRGASAQHARARRRGLPHRRGHLRRGSCSASSPSWRRMSRRTTRWPGHATSNTCSSASSCSSAPRSGSRGAHGAGARCQVAIAMGLAGGVGLCCNFRSWMRSCPRWRPSSGGSAPAVPARAAWLGVGAFLLGPAFWVYNLTHDWATVATGALPGLLEADAARSSPSISCRSCWASAPADRRRICRPMAWTIPAVVGGAVLLLLVRSSWDRPPASRPGARGRAAPHRSRGDPRRRLVRRLRPGPRLLPLVPLLALVLAPAQLTWRVTRIGTVVWVAAYVLAVGLDRRPTSRR